MRPALAALVIFASLPSPASAQAHPNGAIMHALHAKGVDVRRENVYTATVKSNGRSPDVVLAYVVGDEPNDWCGSSGCTLKIFALRAGGPKEIGDFRLWLPITLDGASASGYPIFGVARHGGGVTKPYCDELRFSGAEYDEPTQGAGSVGRRRCSAAKRILIDWPKKR